MLRRRLPFEQWAALTLAAARVRDEVDAELGRLLLRVADRLHCDGWCGDDDLAALHARLNVCGRFAGADRLLAILDD